MIGSRVARPTRDLTCAVEFYRDVIGLPHTGGFAGHAGYDGAFFALPGGGELELTAGPVPPARWSEEDLLVLYVADRAGLQQRVAALHAHGVEPVTAANPYWDRTGFTVTDPDGYRVVFAVRDTAPPVQIDWHDGPRAQLRDLFALAEDSADQLAGYLELGRVLVARRDARIVGHLQLVPMATSGETELKNMAVLPDEQGGGVGRALVTEAVRRSADAGYARMIVATASADVGNVRFYQRVGFRMSAVDRDAFVPATGYPEPILIDGIELRDRVWFDRELT